MTTHPLPQRRRRVLVELFVTGAQDLTAEDLERAVEQDIADSVRGYRYTVKGIIATADYEELEELAQLREELEKTRAELNEAYRWLVMYEELGLADLLQYVEEV